MTTGTTPRGAFVTFEGLDGSGKTTQIALLADCLRKHGTEPVLLRQPGGTRLGEHLRALLLASRDAAGTGALAPLAELALMFADRAQSIQEVIHPALLAGKTVLCDRYTDSSEAYQGAGRGLGAERVLAMHAAVCNGLQPNLTVLLLPDLDTALGRAQLRNTAQQLHGTDESRFEGEGEAFYRRVHAAYATIAAREPERVHVITHGSIEDVAAGVRAILQMRFPALFASP